MWILFLQPRRMIHSVKPGWRFDSIELNQVTKILKANIRKYQFKLGLARRLFLTCFFCFLLGFGGDSRLDFGFPTKFTASASNLVRFSLAVLLTFFRSLMAD